MKYTELNDFIQTIATVGAIIGLLAVGYELRQGHRIALASQYQARAEATQELFLTMMESGIVPDPLKSSVDNEAKAQRVNLWLWLWTQYDNHFYQHEAGFLDEEAWVAQVSNIRELYGLCEGRFVYDWRKAGLRSSFIAFIESSDDPCEISD
ncbi:hypothetical protein [Congregibacter litoralis]|uniref:Uncharacterized protein n=1 Tax=Congregibacter litoralis KT71 TaxID=314285 RepID=A4ACA5_9GAMM|nr:hypothetical protein [Congregibacter litoralis]EAQ96333.1 hypothetical protein KT71_13140 [Congregibacter litoralis KT71]